MAAQETAAQGTAQWKRFIREVRAELKKVTWPTRKELLSYTSVVFGATVAVAMLIWIIDAGFSGLLRAVIK